MAWHHVKDEDAPASSKFHVGFSIWRCGNCRALAVTGKGTPVSGDCQKCKAKG